MSDSAQEFSADKAKSGTDSIGHTALAVPSKPAHADLIDGMIKSLERPTEKGTGKLEPADKKAGLVGQLEQVPGLIFDIMKMGYDQGLRAITFPKIEDDGVLGELLGLAATAIFAGMTGSLAVWVARGIAVRVVQKFVEDGIKDAVRNGVKLMTKPASVKNDDLKEAFTTTLGNRLLILRTALVMDWAAVHERLSTLSSEQLQESSKRTMENLRDPAALTEAVATQTVIAWTNFLARANYGGMSRWNYWEKNGAPGAVKLEGATDPLDKDYEHRIDPTTENVNPEGVGKLLNNSEVNKLDNIGLLQVFIDTEGNPVSEDAFQMRLDNVGPKVRERIRTAGRVRDLPINKIVRVCARQELIVTPIYAALITADGYMRGYNLGGDSQVVIRNKEPVGPKRALETHHCLRDLIDGNETENCHVNREANDVRMAALAEKAQDLPLTLLEK